MIAVHKATPADVSTVVDYIEKKAAFDRGLGCFDGTLGTTTDRIARALFGQPVFAHALLATSKGTAVGFAFHHYRFSSFQARPSLWLDDLFIDVEARRSGVGLALMDALAVEAVAHECTHMAWIADSRNPSGIPFYTKIGATLVAQKSFQLTYSIAPQFLAEKIVQIRENGFTH